MKKVKKALSTKTSTTSSRIQRAQASLERKMADIQPFIKKTSVLMEEDKGTWLESNELASESYEDVLYS